MFWPVTFMFHQHHINPNPIRDLSAQSAHHEQIFDHGIILVGKDQSQGPSVLTVSNLIVSLLILLLKKVAAHGEPSSTINSFRELGEHFPSRRGHFFSVLHRCAHCQVCTPWWLVCHTPAGFQMLLHLSAVQLLLPPPPGLPEAR